MENFVFFGTTLEGIFDRLFLILSLFSSIVQDMLRSDKVSGVGSNACGPELAEEYRLKEKNVTFSYRIKN